MPLPVEAAPAQDPRVQLAAERTLLAWIRTGLALMGFGFVVARFGLFLHEVATTGSEDWLPTKTGISLAMGVVLVLLGAVVLLGAAVEHLRLLRTYYPDSGFGFRRRPLGVVLCFALVVVGLAMAAHLLLAR